MAGQGEAFPQRRYLKHAVPDWVGLDSCHPVFFITVCCRKRGRNILAVKEAWEVLKEAVRNRKERGKWCCPLFLAMPDHVHGMFCFEGEERMERVISEWKRWTARQLGIEWQRGFFDHRLRSESSALEKRSYILHNPVRAGLVTRPDDWEYVYDEWAERA